MSGSRRTGRRRWRCPSISRTRGSSGSRRRRCWRSRAASTNGACASCATKPATSIDNAYKLRLREQRRRLFGSSKKPYPEFYDPRPYSKSFVMHLDPWYAQSHPDEDFAETFAVWLTPESNWAAALRGLARDQEARLHGRADDVAGRQEAAPQPHRGSRSAAPAASQPALSLQEASAATTASITRTSTIATCASCSPTRPNTPAT